MFMSLIIAMLFEVEQKYIDLFDSLIWHGFIFKTVVTLIIV